MPMSGGFPAARRVRTSGMKSRAEVYSTLMPVLAVKAAVTFRNASLSLPPQSDSTSIEPALRFVGFALPAVAVNPAPRTASAMANVMNLLRCFNLILLLVAAEVPPSLDPGVVLGRIHSGTMLALRRGAVFIFVR